MEKFDISKKIESDIFQKIENIHALVTQRERTHNLCIENYLKFGSPDKDKDLKTLNQALGDAILNSMSSLIDYYCIYCMINIGVSKGKIRKVQYRPIGKSFLIENSCLTKEEKTKSSLDIFKKKFEERLQAECGIEAKDINLYHYWIGYLADAISSTLHEYGVLEKKRASLAFDPSNNSLEFCSEITQYHNCMNFLYCNPCSNSGVRCSIYIDINNCLKHNAIPYVIQRIEEFKDPDEKIIYSFFEIENYKSVFLKDGFLREISEIDFNELKTNLEFKSANGNYELCPLEQKWEIRDIIRIDKTNGFVSKDGETLFFFVDGVFFAKTRKSTLIDAEKSFKAVLSFLIDQIENKVRYFNDQ